MPNWCSNHLTVKGENDEVQRFKQKAVGHSPWEQPPIGEKPNALNFHSLVPIPANVLQAGYEAQGYDWENNQWGCKWGACHGDLIDDNGCELFYGRRGTTLNLGTKTNVPVDYEHAKLIYDKLVKEKQAKGYTAGENGTPYQQTANMGKLQPVKLALSISTSGPEQCAFRNRVSFRNCNN